MIHVRVENAHSSPLHARAEHLFAGRRGVADGNRSSAKPAAGVTVKVRDERFADVFCFWEHVAITHLLFTKVTEQQSPRFTSGRPPDGATTPGSMRSFREKQKDLIHQGKLLPESLVHVITQL